MSSSLHQKVPDFARNQELFFLFADKKFAKIFGFFSDQYTDQYGDNKKFKVNLKDYFYPRVSKIF